MVQVTRRWDSSRRKGLGCSLDCALNSGVGHHIVGKWEKNRYPRRERRRAWLRQAKEVKGTEEAEYEQTVRRHGFHFGQCNRPLVPEPLKPHSSETSHVSVDSSGPSASSSISCVVRRRAGIAR